MHFQAIGSTPETGGQGLATEKVRTPLVLEPSTPCQQTVFSALRRPFSTGQQQ